MIPEICRRMKELKGIDGGNWNAFVQPLKEELFIEDKERLTKGHCWSGLHALTMAYQQMNY